MAASPMVFVNLVVQDLPAEKAFFETLGLSFNPQFTNDEAACMVVNDRAFFMIHTPGSMARFSSLPASDPRTHVSAIFALSADSRADVDRIADLALASGGTAYNPVSDLGFMYLRSFRDPNGHPWEVFWMDPGNVQS